MHQSIPPAPCPPRATAGHLPILSDHVLGNPGVLAHTWLGIMIKTWGLKIGGGLWQIALSSKG